MKDFDRLFQQVPCPFCDAGVKKPCRDARGRFTEWSHVVRQEAYKDAVREGRVEATPLVRQAIETDDL